MNDVGQLPAAARPAGRGEHALDVSLDGDEMGVDQDGLHMWPLGPAVGTDSPSHISPLRRRFVMPRRLGRSLDGADGDSGMPSEAHGFRDGCSAGPRAVRPMQRRVEGDDTRPNRLDRRQSSVRIEERSILEVFLLVFGGTGHRSHSERKDRLDGDRRTRSTRRDCMPGADSHRWASPCRSTARQFADFVHEREIEPLLPPDDVVSDFPRPQHE